MTDDTNPETESTDRETQPPANSALADPTLNAIAGVTDAQFLDDTGDWDGPADYATVPIPDPAVRPKPEWGTDERRAALLRDLRRYGHPDNLPKTYREYGIEFGVSHQTIYRDIQVLREYITAHAGNDAIVTTEMVAQKAVQELLADGDWYDALQAQLDYNAWLFDLGRLEKEPKTSQVQQVGLPDEETELTADERAAFEQLAAMVTDDEGRGPEETGC